MKHISVAQTINDATAISSLLHQLFEEQAVRRPEHMAIECNGESLTYAQLNQRADHIARKLRAEGISTGSLVGLFMSKSCDLFAAMLGILKSGAGYVPIDPKFPPNRVISIIDDAAIKLVLTDRILLPSIQDSVRAETLSSEFILTDETVAAGPAVVSPSDICYVIYTSGSTGRPKGVAIEHRNAVNFARALKSLYKISDSDRVYQGFSVAFDASVEEIWAAFSIGGTLVVPTEDVARSTAEAADFITSQNISYFSTVPSFLTLITPPLASLRALVLGGEVCTTGLISKWVRDGLRILNTYGPTEATVVATAHECRRGREVTIGTALPGCELHVLDEDQKPVGQGEVGELYIGGASVGRGYLNQPELTESKFVTIPAIDCSNRIYRTNDLVKILPNGELQFVGRSDTQVKIRGFRIELSEIETVIREFPGIKQAVATTIESDGLPEIAAFVIYNAPADQLNRNNLIELLRSRLPEYMIPKYLDIAAALPTMTSGKIDRKALPIPVQLLRPQVTNIDLPKTEMQRQLKEVWQRILNILAVSIDDDFFTDLHGHSLVAARVVSEFRRVMNTDLSVRDIYQKRTIRKIASQIEERQRESSIQAPPSIRTRRALQEASDFSPLPRFRFICVFLQVVGLLAFSSVVSIPIAGVVLLVLQVLDGSIAWERAAEFVTVGGFALWPSWLLLSIALKWLVIGRYKPGRHSVWSFYYFRWWLVTRFQSLAWSEMFVDTPLMNLYFRAMGAKIGRNCSIGSPICAAFDLISIGENASIGAETHMLGYKVENGWLELGPVTIGKRCYVGTHCALGLNVEMADGSRLEDLSVIPDHGRTGSGEFWRGSPAEKVVGKRTPVPNLHGRLLNFFFGMVHLALIYLMGYILILSALPAIGIIAAALYLGGPFAGFVGSLAAVPISILWYLKLVTTIKAIFIGRLKPGVYSTRSLTFLRFWFFRYLMTNTRHIVLPLYATLFFPRFLRSLGAKIGRHVEISTVTQALPDLLEIGDGSFLADGCIVGGHQICGGRIELGANRIGKRTFVGNSAFVPAGVDLAEDNLIGVLSTPPTNVAATLDSTRWLGSPGFLLPNTQKVSCFSARKTFEPGSISFSARLGVDMLRIVLPGLISMTSAAAFCTAIIMAYAAMPLGLLMLCAPAATFAIGFFTLIVVATLRYLFIRQYRPVVKPLWCSYVWFNEVVNALYEAVAAPILAPMLGTPLAAWFMRLIGCRVGKWVFLETTLFSEFDLVQIGDRAALNLGSTIQTHLFEDRVMKSDMITIGNFCSVGNMAVVLYETRMDTGSVLEPLSVLMKGECLPSWTRWHGIPSQLVDTGKLNQDRQRRKLAARTNAQVRALKQNIWRASTSAIGIQAGLKTLTFGESNKSVLQKSKSAWRVMQSAKHS